MATTEKKENILEKEVKAAEAATKKVAKASAETAKKAVSATKKAAKASGETVKKAAAATKKAVKETGSKVTTPAAVKNAEITLQYQGSDFDVTNIALKAQEVFRSTGSKTPIKSLKVYLKPEDRTAYYVVNGNITGAFAL
ncbi:MAG: hypothetical protein IKS11_07020 [Lachnospiraceae bacterium]|jgi:hypothetical protein|nr:hypothetical protein [Lachnospiraceae bacterium]